MFGRHIGQRGALQGVIALRTSAMSAAGREAKKCKRHKILTVFTSVSILNNGQDLHGIEREPTDGVKVQHTLVQAPLMDLAGTAIRRR